MARGGAIMVAVGLVAAAAVLPVPAAVRGQRPPPTIRDVRLENAEALSSFYAALRELDLGLDRKVRVLHYGDSNVAADLWTKVSRERLQDRFGDGGPGYVVPGFGSRHDRALKVHRGPGWKARRKGFARDFGPLDGLWGLGGVAAEGRGAGAWVRLETPPMARGGILEVHALGRPNGGELEVTIDGGDPVRIATDTGHPGLVQRRWKLAPGTHRARIRVRGWRPVRLLGVTVEHEGSGVVYDTLGINGHRASAILQWDADLLRAQLEARPPDLIVLSYGGNEALDPQLGMDTYARHLELAVERMQRLAPNASVLLVGPLPMCPVDLPIDRQTVLRRVARVAAVQRRVARRAAVAYWDSSRLADEGASLCSWRHRDPALISGDGLHLSKRGYGIVGTRFTKALLRPVTTRLARR